MHLEVQVALNFVISYLYNKLPRRRVNIFGEELEKALKDKFRGHWYPDKPVKGSAYRCLKTGDPLDAVFERAAKESGVPIQDILENLPQDLAVWVDPGEVSYRIGEKGTIKILYNETTDIHEEANADREVIKTFNPEAQCFRPIDAVLGALNLSPKGSPPLPQDVSPTTAFKGPGSPSPVAPSATFLPRTTAPLTFTTATFAQTKFGSTKLKTNSKRANRSPHRNEVQDRDATVVSHLNQKTFRKEEKKNDKAFHNFRMSPTEFSNYIKQRAMQQQAGSHSHSGQGGSPGRSLSPSINPQDYMYTSYYRPSTLFDNYHNGDIYQKLPYLEPSQYYPVQPNTPHSPP